MAAVIGLTLGAAMALNSQHAHAGPNCTANSDIGSEERALLTLINNYRADRGLNTLAMSETLNRAASWKSQHMVRTGFFGHDDIVLGRTFSDRLRDCGYDFNTSTAENIAAGNETAVAIFALWRDGASHNANMLNPDFNAIGIGRAYGVAAPYTWYWTVVFGGVVDAAPAPPPVRRPVTSGDVNCDGNVDPIDAAFILQFSARLIDTLSCSTEGDVNGDGGIGPLDATLILQMAAGLLASPG